MDQQHGALHQSINQKLSAVDVPAAIRWYSHFIGACVPRVQQQLHHFLNQ